MSVELAADVAGPTPERATLRILSPEGTEPVEHEVPVPWRGTLDIPRGRSITAAAEGFWAPTVSADSDVVELMLRPLGTIRFSAEAPRGLDLETMNVQFRDTPQGRRASEVFVAVGASPCRATGSSWWCGLPAGTLDLRLSAEGVAPSYRWSLEVPPGAEVDLGELRFEAGAALAGWVDLPSPDARARITLTRSGFDVEPSDVERERRRSTHSFETSTTERGFFQLTGLPLGSYRLVATLDGRAPSDIDGLQLDEAAEHLLDEAIELEPWARAEIWLEPPLDPHGSPWQLRVLRPRPGSHVLDEVATGFSREGRWAAPELPAGTYLVEVADEAAVWHSEQLELIAGSSEHWIALDVVPVRGSVFSGDDPLRARIVFGGQEKPRLAFESDEEGYFEGLLPREGTWAVDLRFGASARIRQTVPEVDVEIADGKSYAEVEIRIPDTRIAGRVEEQGRPVPEALVLVKRREGDPNGAGSASLRTDEEGRFEARGLDPGGLALRALRDASLSSWILVDLAEDEPVEDLVLRLERQREISGRVVHRGSGVPGALVVARAAGESFLPWTAESTTAADGGFSLEIPADADSVDLLVLPPGFGVALERIDLRARGENPVLVVPVTAESGTLYLRTRPPLAAAVLIRERARVEVAWLRKMLLRSGLGAWDDEHFAWRLDTATPGFYQLCPPAAAPEACSHGQLAPGGELLLESPAGDRRDTPESASAGDELNRSGR